jgi:hypothetical protein
MAASSGRSSWISNVGGKTSRVGAAKHMLARLDGAYPRGFATSSVSDGKYSRADIKMVP